MQNVCSCLFSGSAQPQPLLQVFLIQITLARSLVNIHAPGLSLWDLLQSLWKSKKGKSHLTLEMFWVGTLPLWRLVRIVVALAPGPTSGAVGQNVDAWDILWNNNNIFSKFCQASIFLQLLFLPPILSVKGILHQKIFYCLNLIFWIIMGCGIARFGRKGLKTTETWKFWSQILSPGVLRRGAPGVSRHGAMGFRGAAQGFRGAAPWGFEGRRHGVSRGGATDKRLQWFIIWRCPSRSLVIRSKIWDLGDRKFFGGGSL